MVILENGAAIITGEINKESIIWDIYLQISKTKATTCTSTSQGLTIILPLQHNQMLLLTTIPHASSPEHQIDSIKSNKDY